MDSISICYLILHYKNISDTRKCIRSIEATAGLGRKIVVVDNGSDDGSGELLKREFNDLKDYYVLCLPENLGFSKGNNAGYDYIRKELNVDYIVVTNNDVVFYQKDFERKIHEIYKRTSFFVLGPDIYIPGNREHQSPLFKNGITVKQLEKELNEYKYYQNNPDAFAKRLKIHAVKNRICTRFSLIRCIYSFIRKKDNLDYKCEYEGVGLQGSCIIVSGKYIEAEGKMFDPEPFLFCEEIFLFYKCKEKGYKIVYSPEVGIRHEEAASLKNAKKDLRNRLRFMLNHHVKAREQLLDYLRNMELDND